MVKGEVPSYKIYESDSFLAFLDINPESPGHALVIPKDHYRWVWDVPNIGEYFEIVQKVAKAQQKAFGTDWVISKIVGEEVPHAHIWVFPNREVLGDKRDFEQNQKKITEALSSI